MHMFSSKNISSKLIEFSSWRKIRDCIKIWSRNHNFDINSLVSSLKSELDKEEKKGNNAVKMREARKNLVNA